MLLKREMAIELIMRGDAKCHHTITGFVTVLAITQIQDSSGVGQTYGIGIDITIILKSLTGIIVSSRQVMTELTAYIVCIRREER